MLDVGFNTSLGFVDAGFDLVDFQYAYVSYCFLFIFPRGFYAIEGARGQVQVFVKLELWFESLVLLGSFTA